MKRYKNTLTSFHSFPLKAGNTSPTSSHARKTENIFIPKVGVFRLRKLYKQILILYYLKHKPLCFVKSSQIIVSFSKK